MQLEQAPQQDTPVAILATSAETDGAFVMLSCTLPPYSYGRPLHRHSGHVEGGYVVAGTLALTRGERTVMLSRGGAFSVVAGVEHTWWNPTAEPTTLLLIFVPGAGPAEIAGLLIDDPGSAAPPLDSS